MFPDEPTDEEEQQKLPEDYDTPFRPADDTDPNDRLDDTHPTTDSNIDAHEMYDEGISGAAEAEEPYTA
jgi:hypothetical protein